MFKERRTHKRFPISEVLLYRRIGEGESKRFSNGSATDISRGGLLFSTDELLFVGEQLELCFRRKTAFADSHMTAEVMRVVQNQDGYAVGARFLPTHVNANEAAVKQSAVW